MLMIAPEPWRSMTGRACLQPRNTLFRLRSTCASHTSSVISTGPPAAEPPTLFTRMSRRPNFFTQAAIISATAAPLLTSQICVAVPGAFCSVSSRLRASRSTANTFAPSSTNRTVVARPLPQPGPIEPAPVMSATLSLRREPIEALRVVDQHRLALLFGRRDFSEQVDEIAVVGHFAQVGMRPVGAPDGAVAEIGDQLARERHRVLPRRMLPRDALGAAHLDPDA